MRNLHATGFGGSAPATPGFIAFYPPECSIFLRCRGQVLPRPLAFRPLSRLLGLHPCIALSHPDSGGIIIYQACSMRYKISSNGDYPLNFVSHSRGSLHTVSTISVSVIIRFRPW